MADGAPASSAVAFPMPSTSRREGEAKTAGSVVTGAAEWNEDAVKTAAAGRSAGPVFRKGWPGKIEEPGLTAAPATTVVRSRSFSQRKKIALPFHWGDQHSAKREIPPRKHEIWETRMKRGMAVFLRISLELFVPSSFRIFVFRICFSHYSSIPGFHHSPVPSFHPFYPACPVKCCTTFHWGLLRPVFFF
jgi:hypothetical protein